MSQTQGIYNFNRSIVIHAKNNRERYFQTRYGSKFCTRYIVEFMTKHNDPDAKELFEVAKLALGEKNEVTEYGHGFRAPENCRRVNNSDAIYHPTRHVNGSHHHACLRYSEESYITHDIVYLRYPEENPLIVHHVLFKEMGPMTPTGWSYLPDQNLYYIECKP